MQSENSIRSLQLPTLAPSTHLSTGIDSEASIPSVEMYHQIRDALQADAHVLKLSTRQPLTTQTRDQPETVAFTDLLLNKLAENPKLLEEVALEATKHLTDQSLKSLDSSNSSTLNHEDAETELGTATARPQTKRRREDHWYTNTYGSQTETDVEFPQTKRRRQEPATIDLTADEVPVHRPEIPQHTTSSQSDCPTIEGGLTLPRAAEYSVVYSVLLCECCNETVEGKEWDTHVTSTAHQQGSRESVQTPPLQITSSQEEQDENSTASSPSTLKDEPSPPSVRRSKRGPRTRRRAHPEIHVHVDERTPPPHSFDETSASSTTTDSFEQENTPPSTQRVPPRRQSTRRNARRIVSQPQDSFSHPASRRAAPVQHHRLPDLLYTPMRERIQRHSTRLSHTPRSVSSSVAHSRVALEEITRLMENESREESVEL